MVVSMQTCSLCWAPSWCDTTVNRKFYTEDDQDSVKPKLTFTTCWAYTANKMTDGWYIFVIFPTKQDLTFHENCLQWRQFAIVYSGGNLHEMLKPVLFKQWEKCFNISSAAKLYPGCYALKKLPVWQISRVNIVGFDNLHEQSVFRQIPYLL